MSARTTITFLMATAAVVLVLGAPAAQADQPPAFDIPVEVIPNIVVPPAVNGAATDLSTAVLNFILGINAGNPGAVNGLFGVVGDGFCALAAGSSNPCTTGR
ncbi:hypothetical protein [Antrihabitans cavernicola]|uniref:DUF320 domain-containing protein n=1 Tax=Antrihabitans cavernicola TaxID=2495913 RepID=A0A5A7SB22_9NOCA|nr:hypothetical protein [Spelaeibacter cavernicola]KAA0023126.1 hypothetical protein FOY51_11670 [Spelaeibacter cavernicola]